MGGSKDSVLALETNDKSCKTIRSSDFCLKLNRMKGNTDKGIMHMNVILNLILRPGPSTHRKKVVPPAAVFVPH